MHRQLLVLLPLLLTFEWAQPAEEPGDPSLVGTLTWTKVQYLGGAVGIRGKSETWDNSITISANLIRLRLKDGTTIDVDPKQLTALNYEGIREHRVGAGDYIVAPLSPLFTLGLIHDLKAKKHYMLIEYLTAEGRPSGLLLRAHKENYRAILDALQRSSGLQDGDQEGPNAKRKAPDPHP